ncbi:hypothetical protein PFISCL1PPCAC_3493, partial [Pristionchus fissidentatus]
LQEVEYILPEIESDGSVVMTIRTTSKNYDSRLRYTLDTWWKSVANKVYVISDDYDRESVQTARRILGEHFIETKCGSEYHSPSLACKCKAELDMLYKADARWSWRFDDDTYVNVPLLMRTLAEFNSEERILIGRTTMGPWNLLFRGREYNITFPTGNALCMSRPLLHCL